MTVVTTAVPEGRPATGPPEARGLERDQIRLLTARPDGVEDGVFSDVSNQLEPGDLLVVNTSATRAAAIDADWRDRPVTVHLSTLLDEGRWLIEVRRPDGSGYVDDLVPAGTIQIGHEATVVLDSPLDPTAPRLWRARITTPVPVHLYMETHGRPISYDYLQDRWPLSAYQTIFARPDDQAGASAEMPSAGRPFTPHGVAHLIRNGITIAPLSLHTGVSSLERHEVPGIERYEVPPMTAELANLTRRRGNRVVAVGTTVTRALETVTAPDGEARAGSGWTDLVLSPARPARLVDGLITGWHPAEASHLMLLEAVAGTELVHRSYRHAAQAGYLWHEFGDSCLLLP